MPPVASFSSQTSTASAATATINSGSCSKKAHSHGTNVSESAFYKDWRWTAQLVAVVTLAWFSFKANAKVASASFAAGFFVGCDPKRFGFTPNESPSFSGGCGEEVEPWVQGHSHELFTLGYSFFKKMAHLTHGHGHLHGWDLIEAVGAPFGLGRQTAGFIQWMRKS